jgi:hypothetical protein
MSDAPTITFRLGPPLPQTPDPAPVFPSISYELSLRSPEFDVSGDVVLNYRNGSFQQVNIIGNITSLDVIGWPQYGETGRLIILMKNTGNFTVSNWVKAKWVNGDAPELTVGAGAEDMVVLLTRTAGAVRYGNLIGQNYRLPV